MTVDSRGLMNLVPSGLLVFGGGLAKGETDLPGVLHCVQLTYRGGSYVTCDRGFGARGARPFG